MKEREYTIGEMSIVVDNVKKEFEKFEDNVDIKFEKLTSSISDLVTAFNQLNEYKSEIQGMMRATIFWTSLVCTVIVSLGVYAINLTIDYKVDQKIKISEQGLKEYFATKEFNVTQ